jgi:DNA-binding transcriptional LysR family regulator
LTSSKIAPILVRVSYPLDRKLVELAAFAAVVEHGGFSAASRVAGLRKATLSERVRLLEQRLDVKLFARGTRLMRLTSEGEAFAAHARRALAATSCAEAAAIESRTKPSGMLRLSVPPPLAVALLEGVIAPYLRQHPDVDVEMEASTRTIDLMREGFDLAIRIGRLPHSSLSVRRLGHASGGYYASRAYLARRGTPEQPEDLVHHDTIAMPRGDRIARWQFVSGRRKRVVVVRPRVLVSSFELGIEAAVAGLGVIPSAHRSVRPYVAKKQVVPVLESWTPPSFEVNALFVPASAAAPKTRRMIDALSAWFAVQKGSI